MWIDSHQGQGLKARRKAITPESCFQAVPCANDFEGIGIKPHLPLEIQHLLWILLPSMHRERELPGPSLSPMDLGGWYFSAFPGLSLLPLFSCTECTLPLAHCRPPQGGEPPLCTQISQPKPSWLYKSHHSFLSPKPARSSCLGDPALGFLLLWLLPQQQQQCL